MEKKLEETKPYVNFFWEETNFWERNEFLLEMRHLFEKTTCGRCNPLHTVRDMLKYLRRWFVDFRCISTWFVTFRYSCLRLMESAINWFWLRGWLNHKGAICTTTAPLFWNFNTVFGEATTRFVRKNGSLNQYIMSIPSTQFVTFQVIEIMVRGL